MNVSAVPLLSSRGQSLTCRIHPVQMGDGGGADVRAWVTTALVVEVAACWRGQAAHVIMVVMVIERMDGVSTNHSCKWR